MDMSDLEKFRLEDGTELCRMPEHVRLWAVSDPERKDVDFLVFANEAMTNFEVIEVAQARSAILISGEQSSPEARLEQVILEARAADEGIDLTDILRPMLQEMLSSIKPDSQEIDEMTALAEIKDSLAASEESPAEDPLWEVRQKIEAGKLSLPDDEPHNRFSS